MTESNKNFENRVRLLEVTAFLAKVVNAALQAPLIFKKQFYGSKYVHLREKYMRSQFTTMLSKADGRGYGEM